MAHDVVWLNVVQTARYQHNDVSQFTLICDTHCSDLPSSRILSLSTTNNNKPSNCTNITMAFYCDVCHYGCVVLGQAGGWLMMKMNIEITQRWCEMDVWCPHAHSIENMLKLKQHMAQMIPKTEIAWDLKWAINLPTGLHVSEKEMAPIYSLCLFISSTVIQFRSLATTGIQWQWI